MNPNMCSEHVNYKVNICRTWDRDCIDYNKRQYMSIGYSGGGQVL